LLGHGVQRQSSYGRHSFMKANLHTVHIYTTEVTNQRQRDMFKPSQFQTLSSHPSIL
jgi:hypothetical protein